jgi:capsular exopolysaccharide synthesis family protein
VANGKEIFEMMRRSAPEANYEQAPQAEGMVEPVVYEKRLAMRDLFYILLKRKWIPIGFLVTFVAIAAIASMKATPMYKATAQIEIEKEDVKLLSFREVVQVDTTNIDYYNTQYKILKSRSLAEQVAAKLAKNGNPQDANLTRDAVLEMTRIEPVRNSRLVDVIAESRFPEQAARVTNTLAEAYIQQDLNKKIESIRVAADKLQEELTKAKTKVDASEKEFTSYKEQNNIVSLNEKQNLVLEELSRLNEAAATARTERLRKEARYNQLKEMTLEQLRHEQEVTTNPLVESLRKQELAALQNLDSLGKRYGEKHPNMIVAKSDLAKLRETINEQILRVVEEAKNSLDAAKTQEEQLVQAVERKKQDVLEFTRRVNRYESFSRGVETNKKIYDEILNRSRETDISERTEKSNVRIVDRADVPKSPFKPRTKLNLILAVVAGMIVGCGGAFFVEHLNDKVESPEDIEGFLAKPFLGAVPLISGRDGYQELEERAKIADTRPESTTAEAYKTLLAGIHYSPAANGIKTILVTSAGPSEGKTTTLTNLGISAARNGQRVLLVDSDLRRPTLHRIFALRKDVGFTDYLIGEAGLDHVLQDTGIPNLSVIARGTSTPNPSGLISSDRMKDFTNLVKDKFDLVLFDSPPCTVVSDPLIIGTLVDAVVTVSQSGKFSRRMIGRGLDLLDGVKANVLGIVLNEVKERDHRYYYYYGYSYYYGKDGDRKSRRGKSRQGSSKRAARAKDADFGNDV